MRLLADCSRNAIRKQSNLARRTVAKVYQSGVMDELARDRLFSYDGDLPPSFVNVFRWHWFMGMWMGRCLCDDRAEVRLSECAIVLPGSSYLQPYKRPRFIGFCPFRPAQLHAAMA
jgi:hypothetical protein